MDKANKLLYDYYGRSIESYGREEAARRLREVVVLGVRLLVETPGAAEAPRARRVVEQVRSGREDEFVEGMTARVQDTHKAHAKQFLAGIRLVHQNVVLPFPPDVDIPYTQQNIKRWRDFLERLSPRTRLGLDPVTRLSGRVPYRNGVWLADMIFQSGAIPCPPPDIHTVHGALACSAERHNIATPLVVQGDLHLLLNMIEEAESPIQRLEGALHLNAANRKQLKFAGNLTLGPDVLMNWGLAQDKQLVLGDRGRYVLRARKQDGKTAWVLEEILDPTSTSRTMSMRFLWDADEEAWRELSSQLPMDTLNTVRVRLNKVAHHLNLGQDFLRDHTDFIQENIRRLLIFFDICLGAYTQGRGAPLRGGDESAVASFADSLAGLARLCQADAVEDELNIKKRAEKIQQVLDSLTNDRLRELKEIFSDPLPAMDVKKARWDLHYLERLLQEEVDLEHVLTSAGKTLVFLNNIFLSKEAKAQAAKLIAGLRKILREIVSPREVDPMLIALLKSRDDSLLKALQASHPDKEVDLEELSVKLGLLDKPTPAKIVQRFDAAPSDDDPPELLVDKDFLEKCRHFHGAPLDDLFSWLKEDGEPYYDMERLRQALLVNLESYVADGLRKGLKEFEGRHPSEVIRAIHDSLAQVEPVMTAYNRAVARESA
ncbi:MAG: hypothetical protein ACOCVM_05480 [Desulfovibrionaceae bacterium]